MPSLRVPNRGGLTRFPADPVSRPLGLTRFPAVSRPYSPATPKLLSSRALEDFFHGMEHFFHTMEHFFHTMEEKLNGTAPRRLQLRSDIRSCDAEWVD
jgi:hypothetical protein